jgi:hypothetical protein
MPQIDDKAYPALRLWLTDNAITFYQETVAPSELKPHQRIDVDKAIHIPPSVLAIPLLVSSDGYILDGNHRWYAHEQANAVCKIIRIGLPFDDAIAALQFFLQQEPSGELKRELTL